MATTREFDWRTLLLLVAMYALWIGNFVLYRTAPLPLPVHILLGAVAIHLAFTIWHESAHRNVCANRVVNDTIGILGMLPYLAPFYLEKWFHLQHHALMNQRDDPNFIYTDGPLWQLPVRYLRVLRFAHQQMENDPRTKLQKRLDWTPRLVLLIVCAIAFWKGAFFDVGLLWLVPLALSKLVMDWYVNFLPHVGLPPNRFQGTRIIDVGWLTWLLLGHNYHAIHHLWPSLPWHRYRATFNEKLEYLREHGVPIESRITWTRAGTAGLSSSDALAG